MRLDRVICILCGRKWDYHATYFDKRQREIKRTREFSTVPGTAAQKAVVIQSPQPEKKEKVVDLRDAVGRNHSFTFASCRTWPVN